MVDLFRYRHWDLVSKRGLYYILSGLMLLVGLIALWTVGLNKGIDFKGGGSLTYNIAYTDTHAGRLQEDQGTRLSSDISSQLSSKGYSGNTVTFSPSKIDGVKDQILVHTLLKGDEKEDYLKNEAQQVGEIVNTAALVYLPDSPGFSADDMSKALKSAVTGNDASASAASAQTLGNNATASATALATGTNTAASATAQTIGNNAKGSATATAVAPKVKAHAKSITHKGASGAKVVVQLDSKEQVSGTISQELTNRGVLAAILGSCLILLWIWFRYNVGGLGLKYAVAGIIALGHDLLTLVGMVALLRIEVNAPFVAAVLTVLGYSIHDTIVIFDRIRENMRLRKGRTFAETVNISLLETMARSVNTVATVVFTLLALLFFGGPSLRPFVAAMLIGVVVGGYSSIFVASQLLVSWSKGKDREILPEGELAPLVASAKVAPMGRPVVPDGAGSAVSAAPAPTAAPSSDALQRARKAGRTSGRKR